MKLIKLILTFFYLGYIKYAPGTMASFLTMLICFYFIPELFLFPLFILISLVGFALCYFFEKNSNDRDPQYIVIDEVAGMILSILLIPKFFSLYFVAFILFRFFDILKPSFIGKSQNINYGIGVMLDDIFAGLVVFSILLKFHL